MNKNVVYKDNAYDFSNYQINLSKDEIKRREKYTTKQLMINSIRADYKNNVPMKELEQKYNCHFKTIKRYLNFDSARVITTKMTELDQYSSYIYEYIQENKNSHQIFKEIQKKGYSSTYENFFKQFKIRIMTNTLGNSFQLSRHNFYKLLYKNDINRLKLDDENKDALLDYLKKDNQEHAILKLMEEFREIFSKKEKQLLDTWLEKYREHETFKNFISLQTYIKGLMNDKDAVIAQIENTITNGLVEGKVGKIKAKKRSTYGRNSFELLRCLIL